MTSLYAQSIPVTIKYLGNLAAILEKGRKFADEKGIEHDKMIQYRLIADMRGLGGRVDVVFADDEKTFDELSGRITKTIEVLKNVAPDSFDGKEEAPIVLETKVGNFKFTGQRYVSEMVIPNFHFHLSTAYCLLREQGVLIGAFDYMKDVYEKA